MKNDTEYSLYLEYQMGYNRDNGTSIRRKESLSLYLLASPRTPIQRQQNKETLELAKKIRFERREQEANGAQAPSFRTDDFILKITVPKVTETEQKSNRKVIGELSESEQKPNRNRTETEL